MTRWYLIFAILLCATYSASAATSVEQIVVRLVNHDATAGTYTFACDIPSGSVSPRTWSVRPDNGGLGTIEERQTSDRFFTTSKITNADLWHLGCQTNIVENGAWKNIRGDFHIELRQPQDQEIIVYSSNGRTADVACRPQEPASGLVKWIFLDASTHETITFFDQQRITYTVPEAGLWDIECEANGKHYNLPVEYFTSGPAYVPNADGCIPGEPCPPWSGGTCTPSTEVCDSKDNDCDGQTDEGNVCSPTCTPTTETCNTKDDDCDGQVDENNVCSSSACYNSVKDIPATCTGGTITQSMYDGCKHVVCSNGGSSMQILACDKSGYFEMYKQSYTGPNSFQICLASTCLKQTEGYAKSSSFPVCTTTQTCTPATEVCDGADNNCDGQVDENNVCTPASTCYNSVKDIPASCTGASITSDTWNGCRQITCGSMTALACDKAGYFEMYKQSGSGAKICIDGACVSDSNGFAKSTNFPICTGTTSGNQPPQAPTWIEPSEGKSDVDPTDFHIHVNEMVDAEGDLHVATDFEIWDTAANQRVWYSLFNQNIKYHIHNADGTFEGRLAGMNKLENDRAYKVRVRFYSNSNGNNVSAWSERNFRTKPASTDTGGSTAWTLAPGFKIERIGGDINTPVNIVMAPEIYSQLPENQRPLLYVTQLYGQVGVVLKDGTYKQYVGNLLNYDSFGSLPGSGEMGVTGLYVDPVSGDLFVSYVYYDYSASKFKGRVEKFMTNDNGDGFTSRQTVLNDIMVAPSHQVQQITRGPDGKLYLQTGDADSLSTTQDPSKTNGKVLRFNDDGSMPSDNPWPGTYTWALGFRNPFGGNWRPGTNELWVTNNGPDSGDGIYRLTRGFTADWKTGGSTSTKTWYVWPKTVAPTALVFDAGQSGFPSDSTGSVYAVLSGSTYTEGPSDVAKRIQRFKVNSDGSFGGVTDFVRYTGTGYSSIIGATFAKDGLYFTDMYGQDGFIGIAQTRGGIYRVSPGTGNNVGNTSTTFSAGLGPERWYPQGLEMIWECKGIGGSGQYVYDYQFGDGQSAWNIQGTQYHKYPAAGTYTASCTARDKVTGKSASTSTKITLGTVSEPDNPDNTNSTGGTCANSVKDVSVSCTGGTISVDTYDGCRHVTCGSMTVLACDKAGYFEMYKQSGSGVKICLDGACISDSSGFAKSSSFPICSSTNTCTPTTEVCDGKDNDCDSQTDEGGVCTTTTQSVSVNVAQWYPKGREYAFNCNAQGFTATSYGWNFGDGTNWPSAGKDAYYTYNAAGTYTVTCTASGGGVTKSGTLSVNVA